MTLLELSEKLEHLAEKLPGPLRKPLLREITPVKDLFLKQRPPKLLFLGSRNVEKEHLINALFGTEVALSDPTETGAGSWQRFSRTGQGTLRCLDARNPANINRIKSSLGIELPDAVIFLKRSFEEVPAEAGEASETVLAFIRDRSESHLPIIGAIVFEKNGEASESMQAMQGEEALLRGWFRGKLNLSRDLVNTFSVLVQEEHALGEEAAPEQRKSPKGIEQLAEALTQNLPDDAKLEMARLSGVHYRLGFITQKRERQAVLVNKAAMTPRRVGTNAEDLSFAFELFPVVPKPTGLGSAPRGIVLRIEIKHQRLSSEILKGNRLSIPVGPSNSCGGKGRRLISDLEFFCHKSL